MTRLGFVIVARATIPRLVAILALAMLAAVLWAGSPVRAAGVCEERPTLLTWDGDAGSHGDAGTLDWAEPTN